VLGEKRTYIFVEMKKNPEDEAADEEPVNIQINGKACRTPDEDIKWEEEQANAEANAPAKGKAPPKGKKK
jgi:RNA recognition motif-containing protein